MVEAAFPGITTRGFSKQKPCKIRNDIGTYWPVGDSAATDFARSVRLLTSDLRPPDSTSVLTARRTLSSAHDPDWADYLLFGPPGFRL